MLAQAKAGSSSAFDQIITIHQEKITRLVHRLLGWQSDVEDVVQDVFADALNALRKFDGRSTVLTWLTRIAINRCRTHQRRQWLRSKFLRPLPLGDGRVVRDSPWRGEGAQNSLTAQETIQQVHAAIQKLNHRDREIIVLRYLEEQTIEHIAETLKLSRAAVDVRLTRARQRLEKLLAPFIEP